MSRDIEIREVIIEEVVGLGYTEETAREMINTFFREGGLACYFRWGQAFSMFSGKRNVADVLLSHGVL